MAQGENPFGKPVSLKDGSHSPRGGLLSLWFGLRREVGRAEYALSGLGLMTIKYGVEAALIYAYTGRFFSPLDFLNPLLSMRQAFFEPPAPSWLAWTIFAWTMPFLWIAVSMSVRRTANAGATAWIGLLVLVPLLNYVIMLVFCFLPTHRRTDWYGALPEPVVDRRIQSALLGIVTSIGIALIMLLISVYGLSEYGAVLFLGTPVLMGTVSAFIYNRPFPRDLLSSLIVAELAILMTGAAMLLFAFEGIICLVMLLPIAGAMGFLGGFIGYAMAVMTPARSVTLLLPLAVLPIAAGAERLHRPTPTYEVVSTIEIDAPPEQVWPHVAGFSDLPPPPDWYFRLGIAYPQRATIVGSGVGAVRHCEFSTGAFVEPITVWDEPRQLSFDVESQPPPMHELSPYRHVHPPHLDGYLQCRRGEFRLIRLPDNRTRLEGSTWYEFRMYPQDYWTMWSDACIHRIHERVLAHIKQLAESEDPPAASTRWSIPATKTNVAPQHQAGLRYPLLGTPGMRAGRGARATNPASIGGRAGRLNHAELDTHDADHLPLRSKTGLGTGRYCTADSRPDQVARFSRLRSFAWH